MTTSFTSAPYLGPNPPNGPHRLLAGWVQHRRGSDWTEHTARYGPLPLPRRLRRGGNQQLIQLVERSGLRGRGGAGFPTARKLAEVAAGRKPSLVIANGCEGDPASNKDRVLLRIAPHLVLDGIEAAAHAVGAPQAVLCLHQNDPLAQHLRAAIQQRPHTPLLPEVVEVPPHYVASADSSLVNLLTHGTARPGPRRPRPSERGVRGRPTLVDNVETLAHLALIARYGDAWFRGRGTHDAPGTTLVTINGAVQSPGVYEIDLGTPLSEMLRLAGGTAQPLRAVLLGGLAGHWLALPDMRALPLTDQACRQVGASLGIAALIALPIGACGLAASARILHYLASESAGQCGPCMFGLPAIADDLSAIATGQANHSHAQRLWRRLQVISGRGACAHPDGAVNLAASALRVFADDLDAHLAGQPCPGAAYPFPLPIPPDRPSLRPDRSLLTKEMSHGNRQSA